MTTWPPLTITLTDEGADIAVAGVHALTVPASPTIHSDALTAAAKIARRYHRALPVTATGPDGTFHITIDPDGTVTERAAATAAPTESVIVPPDTDPEPTRFPPILPTHAAIATPPAAPSPDTSPDEDDDLPETPHERPIAHRRAGLIIVAPVLALTIASTWFAISTLSGRDHETASQPQPTAHPAHEFGFPDYLYDVDEPIDYPEIVIEPEEAEDPDPMDDPEESTPEPPEVPQTPTPSKPTPEHTPAPTPSPSPRPPAASPQPPAVSPSPSPRPTSPPAQAGRVTGMQTSVSSDGAAVTLTVTVTTTDATPVSVTATVGGTSVSLSGPSSVNGTGTFTGSATMSAGVHAWTTRAGSLTNSGTIETF